MSTVNSSSTRTIIHFNTPTNTKKPLPQVLLQPGAVGISSTSSSAVSASTGATTTSTESDAAANPSGNANDGAKNGHLFRCPSANSAASSSITTTTSCLTSTVDGESDQRRKCCWRRRRKWRKNRQRTTDDDTSRIPLPGDECIVLPPRPHIPPQGIIAASTSTNTDAGMLRRYSSLLRSSLRRRRLAPPPPPPPPTATTVATPTNDESGVKPPSTVEICGNGFQRRQLVDGGFLSTALPTAYCGSDAAVKLPVAARTCCVGVAKSNHSAPTLPCRRRSSSGRQKCDRQMVASSAAGDHRRRSSRSSGSGGYRRRRSSTRQCVLEVSASPPPPLPHSSPGLCGMMAGGDRRALPLPLIGIVRVHLRRRTVDAQLGLGIAGGRDRHIPPTISYLRPGLVAYRSDQLQPGDRLSRVNGIAVDALTHHEIMTLLRNAGTDVVLDVEYDLKAPVFRRRDDINDDAVTEKCAEIVLENDADEEEDAADEDDGCFGGGAHWVTATGSLYGMTLRGGAYGPDTAKSRPLTVTAIRPGGPAHREGRLRVGDRVIAVDGVDVSGATLGAAQRLIRRARLSVQLTVVYDVSVLASLRQTSGRPLVLEIEKTPGANFGVIFAIRRPRRPPLQVNANELPPGNQPSRHSSPLTQQSTTLERTSATKQSIVVEKLIAASIADRCGALHVGDEIHSIDGISLELTGLAEAYQLLKSQASAVRIELTPFHQRQAEEQQWLTRATASPPRRAFYCDYVPHATLQQQAAAAATAQNQRRQFHPDGRPIPASFTAFPRRRFIDPASGTPIEPLYEDNRMVYSARSDSSAVIKNGPPTVADPRLRYMSASMTLGGGGHAPSSAADSPLMARSQRSNSAATGAGPRRRRSSIFPLLFRNNPSGDGGGTTPEEQQEKGSLTTKFLPPETGGSASAASIHRHYPSGVNDGASTSRSGIPCGQLCHAETMEIRLHCVSSSSNANADAGQLLSGGGAPFGIELSYRSGCGGADFDGGGGGEPLIISRIERGSPADKCGVLQVGDRVMAVNDWLTADGTVEEATYVLRRAANASACVQLLVQFDVIEPVLPASGYFVVKLAKRANNLGVVCKSSSVAPCGGGPKGEPLIVADIRTGSVAHRSGSIQIGDRIFAIDNIPLDTCTVEEAMRLLQRSGGVVKLCIARRQSRRPSGHGAKNLHASFDDVNSGGGVVSCFDTHTPHYANLNTSFAAAHTLHQFALSSSSKNINGMWPSAAAHPNDQLYRRGQFAATSFLHQQRQQSAVVYAVELSRRGQPLGITIASASSALGDTDAVIISQLAAGGLAERTGALHVGDEILAVNGRLLDDEAATAAEHSAAAAADDRPVPVSDRRLAAAVRLLQHAEDVVAIRLRRRPSLANDNMSGVPSWWRSSTLSGASVGTVGGASHSAAKAPPTTQPKNHHYQSSAAADQHLLSNSVSNNYNNNNNTITNTTAPLSTINSDSMSDDDVGAHNRLDDGDGDGENSVDSGRGNTHRHRDERDTMLIGSDDLLLGGGGARTAVDNLETPLKSIDSAVESLEGSSADGNVPPASRTAIQRRKKSRQQQQAVQGDERTDYPNNNSNSGPPIASRLSRAPDLISGGGSSSGGAWDSGLSSTADTNAAVFLAAAGGGGGASAGMPPIVGGLECCGCGGSAGGSGGATTTSPSSTGKGTATNTTTSGAASTHEEEDWMRILDALETVGEEEMLRKLEECIMSGRMSSNRPDSVGGCHQCRRKHQYSPPRRNFHFPPLGVDQSSNGILARRLVVTGANSVDESSPNYYASVITATPPPSSLSARQPPVFTPRGGDYGDGTLTEEKRRPQQSPPPANVATSFIYSALKRPKPVPPPPPFRSLSAKGAGGTSGVHSEAAPGSGCPSGTSTLELPPPMPFLPAHHAASISESTAAIPFITSPLSAPTSSLDDGRRAATASDAEAVGETSAESGEPPIHEIFNVVLERCARQRSFGFSVSDGDPTNPGVFVNTVIRGGPADGLLKPLDRILQINGTSIQFLNCDLAVPLLATDRVELLLLRKPHHHNSNQQQQQSAEQQALFNNNNNLIQKQHSAFI